MRYSLSFHLHGLFIFIPFSLHSHLLFRLFMTMDSRFSTLFPIFSFNFLGGSKLLIVMIYMYVSTNECLHFVSDLITCKIAISILHFCCQLFIMSVQKKVFGDEVKRKWLTLQHLSCEHLT